MEEDQYTFNFPYFYYSLDQLENTPDAFYLVIDYILTAGPDDWSNYGWYVYYV